MAAVTLVGDPSLGRSLVSLKAMIRTILKEGSGFLIEFNHLEGQGEQVVGSETLPTVPPFLEQVL